MPTDKNTDVIKSISTHFTRSEVENDIKTFYANITTSINDLKTKYNNKISVLRMPENIFTDDYGIGFIIEEGSFEAD